MSSALQPSLVFTESAAAKVSALIHEEGNLKLNLRVSIAGGGCSGFQYGFAFDEKIRDDDRVIKKTVQDEDGDEGEGGSTTVCLLVDPLSLQYLVGAEIDYREDINGAQFVIRNPNAKTTCSCGSSFSA